MNFLLVSLTVLTGGNAIEECKQGMMQYFSLEGSKYPIQAEFEICGKMSESCCVMNDEVRIWSLWKNYSYRKIKSYTVFIMHQYDNLLKFYHIFLGLKRKYIETVSNQSRDIDLKFKTCGRSSRMTDDQRKLGQQKRVGLQKERMLQQVSPGVSKKTKRREGGQSRNKSLKRRAH